MKRNAPNIVESMPTKGLEQISRKKTNILILKKLQNCFHLGCATGTMCSERKDSECFKRKDLVRIACGISLKTTISTTTRNDEVRFTSNFDISDKHATIINRSSNIAQERTTVIPSIDSTPIINQVTTARVKDLTSSLELPLGFDDNVTTTTISLTTPTVTEVKLTTTYLPTITQTPSKFFLIISFISNKKLCSKKF
uniref:FHA domain-containing protein n=1 Tax=Heterorhabditis bacteriophora TaxID=37862 RepID=A0A1I7W730_HETBA